MSGETRMSVIGNLTADPDLRFSPGGVAVASFTVASTPRLYDRDGDQWRDGEPLFLRCSVWRQPAEHVADSLRRGAREAASSSAPAQAAEHHPNDTAAVSARMAAADRDRQRHQQQLAQTRRSRLSLRL
jgi:single-strand DNA-binding protein